MIPQDPRSPFQQVRWIEIYNAGAQEIPAFGAVEVTGATAPESSSQLTPGAGRTVVTVRRPSCDSSPRVMFNSMLPVAVGAYGFGTLDLPCWALCATTSSGKKIGTKKDSFVLEEEKSGFIVFGGSFTLESGSVATRIAYPAVRYGIYEATLQENMCPATTEADISGITFVGECCDDETISGTKTAKNRMALAGCNGDRVYVLRYCDGSTDSWAILQVQHHPKYLLVEDPYYASCGLHFPKNQFAVMDCCQADTEAEITMYEHTYVADAQLVKAGYTAGTAGTGQQVCTIQLQTKTETFCAFDPYTPSSFANAGTAITFVPLHIQADTVDDGTCLEKVRQWIYVLCYDAEDSPVDIVCTEPCE